MFPVVSEITVTLTLISMASQSIANIMHGQIGIIKKINQERRSLSVGLNILSNHICVLISFSVCSSFMFFYISMICMQQLKMNTGHLS